MGFPVVGKDFEIKGLQKQMRSLSAETGRSAGPTGSMYAASVCQVGDDWAPSVVKSSVTAGILQWTYFEDKHGAS
jgi:hypothetical protein